MKFFLRKNIIIENYNNIEPANEIDELEETISKIPKFIKEINIPTEILNSFKIKPNLNKEFWGDEILNENIREQLMKIAQDFFDELNAPEDLEIIDVILTGSLANYNWSRFSDVDLHVIVDFSKINTTEEFIKKLFDSYKNNWNNKHDISIKGFPVELYVQDIKEKLSANAVYSVKRNKWILKPEKDNFKLNRNIIKNKAITFFEKLKEIRDLYKNGDYQKTLDKSQKLKDKIKKYRKSGLESGGEYSIENLVFKVLRRTSFLETLFDINSKAYDQIMSINENT
jgi:predicted nucleotidyltransferase